MKRIWFVSFGLLLAAVLAGCSGQVDFAAPAATATPAPTAAPIESSASPTETPAPALSPAAEVGVEYEDLSFLSDDPRQVYDLAYKLRYALYGIPDNILWQDSTPQFKQHSDDGVSVRSEGNYLLYENPYSDFTDLMQRVFTADFIKSLGPLYTEKFVDLNGHLATSTDDALLCPMMDDLSRTVMDNCPDTYRLESATNDTVAFALIAHYDRNWDTSFTPEDMDVYTIEYPIRLVRTADGWRVDEFHCTDFGYGEALFEPPLTEQDAQIPTPDFLTEEQKQLYLRAYKMMLVRAGTYIIDDTQFSPATRRTRPARRRTPSPWTAAITRPRCIAIGIGISFTPRCGTSLRRTFWLTPICPRTGSAISVRWMTICIISSPSAAWRPVMTRPRPR